MEISCKTGYIRCQLVNDNSQLFLKLSKEFSPPYTSCKSNLDFSKFVRWIEERGGDGLQYINNKPTLIYKRLMSELHACI